MSHQDVILVVSIAQAVSLLVSLCNVLVSLDLKEHCDYFLSPKSMSVMHALADLEPSFKKYFLKSLDGDDSNIIDTYRCES